MTHQSAELRRQVFTTSRELEYFTEAELVTQTGYPRNEWWPGVLVKELVDNSLDACEQASIAPEIGIRFGPQELLVTDNGPGIPHHLVTRILDFASRTSDKAAYVSPTRGAQGNALKTVVAMPYVLNQGNPATIEIESHGLRHVLAVSTDHIARRPSIEHQVTEIVRIGGTRIRIPRNSACSQGDGADPGFLQRLLFDCWLFNPHATFTLEMDGHTIHYDRANGEWQKWRPCDPTSPHWYNLERFENLVASYISAERTGGRSLTVREFVSEFRGLSGTAKQKQVVSRSDLDRAYLRDLLAGSGRLDTAALERLLTNMRLESAPVKPEAFGILGEPYFRQRMLAGGTDPSFRYKRVAGTAEDLPYVVECAFRMTDDAVWRGSHIALNWSVPLSDPLQENQFHCGSQSAWGLSALLASNQIHPSDDPICFVLHLICPRLQFLDRGKGSVTIPFADAVAKAAVHVTKEWAAIKKKQQTDRKQAARAEENLRRGRTSRINVKQAAYDAIPDAYGKASGGGQYPANARQIMYAARPVIQEVTAKSLDDGYFTQSLLPDFIQEHPELTATWDVVYDARGHLLEPHTNYEIGLGTLGVREYLAELREHGVGPLALTLPEISAQFPTRGPTNRYGTILYIEKEGFLPLLQQSGFGERYDLAIMSSKGMGTTAVRTLIERLHTEVKILVLHDFDKSGFSILGTLTRDTRRYSYAIEPKVVDLGLRLADVQQWNLQAEDVSHTSNPTENLALNGAIEDEIEFLRGKRVSPYDEDRYGGRRVELNAFTSEAFVQWLESKLAEHGVCKVVPETARLEQAYRRAAGIRRYRSILSRATADVQRFAEGLEVPEDLRERIVEHMKRHPRQSWDLAIELLVQDPTLM
jgi:DNA topoisomerase VI subunit B